MLDEALEVLRLAGRIDLDDLTRTTAGGLHLATMGGLWQALAFGFAGVRPVGDTLRVDPVLPDAWRALELNLRFRGARVKIHAARDALTLSSDPPTPVLLDGPHDARSHTPAGTRLERHGRSRRKNPDEQDPGRDRQQRRRPSRARRRLRRRRPARRRDRGGARAGERGADSARRSRGRSDPVPLDR